MASTLYRETRPGTRLGAREARARDSRPPQTGAPDEATPDDRARDWAEIQERMLVPLYEAVYDRLEVDTDTRLLALGCGSGLALLLAAARGAAVAGYDTDQRKLALARERLLPVRRGPCADFGPGFDLVTAFDPAVSGADLLPPLTAAARSVGRGVPVVLAGWGPPERCATSRVLRVAERLAEPRRPAGPATRLSGRDDLEETARAAGLRPDGSGRVSCPFGYPDLGSAVRGMLSTGLFDAAAQATDRQQVEKELAEALHPYRRPDGTVRMENVFRYLVART
jgi:SAM-dependent methyltransferase